MAEAAVSDQQALAGFIDKWRVRWPEWSVAEVFVAPAQREVTVAWFALLQELLDAAWAGSDATPGQAKLAWWAEELQGWSQGRRRHPIGIALQRCPAPWLQLAATLPALLDSREPANDAQQAFAVLLPFAASVDEVGRALFTMDGLIKLESVQPANMQIDSLQPANFVHGLLAQHLMLRGDAAVPLRTRARIGDGHAIVQVWATELLQRWPARSSGARPQRMFMTLLRERVRRSVAGGDFAQPLPRITALWAAWRAARG